MRYAVLVMLLVLLAGFFHIMFIMFDNMYYNETSGVIPKMSSVFNNTLDSDTRNNTWNRTVMLRDAFGIGRVVCIILVPVAIAIQAVEKPKMEG